MRSSNQRWFCTCCGIEQLSSMTTPNVKIIGVEWKTCSWKCHKEIQWRRTLSLMNKDYYPNPNPELEDWQK